MTARLSYQPSGHSVAVVWTYENCLEICPGFRVPGLMSTPYIDPSPVQELCADGFSVKFRDVVFATFLFAFIATNWNVLNEPLTYIQAYWTFDWCS